jgi:solute carrier family 35 protein E3
VLLVGVGVATVTDLQLNTVGSVLSLLAIITTCIAQIVSFQLDIYSSFSSVSHLSQNHLHNTNFDVFEVINITK